MQSLVPLFAVSLALGSSAIAADSELMYELNDRGLASLTFAGHSFLKHPSDGDFKVFARTPIFDDGKEFDPDMSTASRTFDEAQTLHLDYPWGAVEVVYRPVGTTRLDLEVTVSNTSDRTIQSLALQAARLNYPATPTIESIGIAPSRFTGGNYGVADSGSRPPVILADYGSGSLLVAGDRYADDFAASISFAEGDGRINRSALHFKNIPPGDSRTATLSLRFGPPNSTLRAMAGDILDGYAKAHPQELRWPDRRPIGKIFLASARNGEDQMTTNPNRWFMNANDIDVSTDVGKQEFRERLLKFADVSVAALKELGAQGGVTWDPEGQRTGHTYYGDPRIIPEIAPEMEYHGDQDLATVDAYFAKFQEAGLHHGICIRPQVVSLDGQYWVQREPVNAEESMQEMVAKIDYAVKRWGSTLIYIDSDYAVTAAQYKTLHERFSNVLLIPEWGARTPQTFAYSAPMVSLFHFGVTGTPASVYEIYPEAFVVNLIDNIGTVEPSVHKAVRKSVQRGDIPMINGWYVHAGTRAVQALYQDEKKEKKSDQ